MPSCGVCLSVCVCVSVTFVHCVKTNKHIFQIFSPSGSHTILVFPYQTAWQYFDGNPLNRGVECMRGRLKSQFSTNIWLHRGCISHLRLAFCLMRVLDHQVPHAVTHSARLTKRCLALYTQSRSTARLDVTPKTTELNRIVYTGKSKAKVNNNKKTALEVLYYWSNKANYWQTRSIARPLCDIRANCLAWVFVKLLSNKF